MFGILREDHFELKALNNARKCTMTSVAAHTLYEKSNPTKLPGPGGVLDLTQTAFEQNGDSVIVRGSRFIPDEGQNYIKLEGAKLLGYRTVSFAATADPVMMHKMHDITQAIQERVANNFESISDFYLDFKIYGANEGVTFYRWSYERHCGTPPDMAIVIEAVAKTQELADTICSFARSTLLHFGYEGRKSTAGNLAFPFSPSDFSGGAVYGFSVYCLMPHSDDDNTSLFPIKIHECKEGIWHE
jgi:hypothetical protein